MAKSGTCKALCGLAYCIAVAVSDECKWSDKL